MPIVELPKPGAPLTQGDILKGITLFSTKDSWAGGVHVEAPFDMCLVVSRPCAIAHKQHVIVAGIANYPDGVPKEANDFERVLDFLTGRRDGIRSPDLFYLGHLPAETGRFCARMDSLHTIHIPSDQAVMDEFLKVNRVASLIADFARDLHLRIFSAFASLGFEDNSWFSTEDLEWLVNQGRSDISKAEHSVNDLLTQKSSLAAQGKQFAEKSLTSAEAKLDELRTKVAPFEAELKRRQTK
jgi:hypothetical protein